MGIFSFFSSLFRGSRSSRSLDRRDIGQPAGLLRIDPFLKQADENLRRQNQAKRRQGIAVATPNQGDVNASVNTPGEANRLIRRLNIGAGSDIPRDKLTQTQIEAIIDRKKKEKAEQDAQERGLSVFLRTSGALQSLFTRDTDIPEAIDEFTLGRRKTLGGA